MITKLINVEQGQVLPKKDGGTWTATVLTYTNFKGEQKQQKLGERSPLINTANTLVTGDTVEFTFDTSGQYPRLTGIEKKPEGFQTSQPSFKKPGFQKSNNIGMQVGNISNCASLIYSNKLTESLKDAVDMVLETHKYIEAKLQGTPAAAPKKVAAPAPTFEISNEDDPF